MDASFGRKLHEAWGLVAPQAHPSEAEILGYPGSDREAAIEAHAALCPRCRRRLMALQAGPLLLRRWIPLGAAAALALGVFLWRPERGTPSSPAAPAPSAARLLPPQVLLEPGRACRAEGRDLEAVAGEAVLLTLRQGGSLKAGRTALDLTLERGQLLVESVGERISLKVGGWEASLQEGTLAAEAPGTPAAFLLPSAAAAEEPRITVIRGSVRVSSSLGDAVRQLGTGESVGEPIAWAGPRWQGAQDDAVERVRDGSRVFLHPPTEGYVFEALLRKRQAGAEAGIVFQVAGRTWGVPVGGNLLPAQGNWTRLRIAVDPGWCRITLGARPLVDQAAGELGRKLEEARVQGVGLRAWGGDLEVREARWRPLGGTP